MNIGRPLWAAGRAAPRRALVSAPSVAPSVGGVPGFTTVIGLEVHAQLQAPATKLFSRAPGAMAGRGLGPNEAVDFFDAALPGTYPMLNRVAVQQAARAGLALGATVAPVSWFERKHYYYYDLPHAYQVTQQRAPLASGGSLELAGGRRLRLNRLQLEMDSGKTNHEEDAPSATDPTNMNEAESAGRCLVDLNRAGVALVEFVFEPDLRSPEEAGDAVRTLVALLKHTGSCDGSMESGALRVDLNVSVVPNAFLDSPSTEEGNGKGAPPSEAERAKRLLSGNRVEVKNMNSAKFLVAAAHYEAKRQAAVLRDGQRVSAETRGWDAKAKATFRQRSKEDAYDYRFFPEPDMPPVSLSESEIAALRASLPEMPADMRRRFESTAYGGYGLSANDAEILVGEPLAASFFEAVLKAGPQGLAPRQVSSWICNHLWGALAGRDMTPATFLTSGGPGAGLAPLISASQFAELVALVDSQAALNLATGKKVLEAMLDDAEQASALLARGKATGVATGEVKGGVRSAAAIVKAQGWGVVSEASTLLGFASAAVNDPSKAKDLAEWQAAAKPLKPGSTDPSDPKRAAKLAKFFLGAAMKHAKGQASPIDLASAVNAALQATLGLT